MHGPKDQCSECHKFFVDLKCHMMDKHPEVAAVNRALAAAEDQTRARVAERMLAAAATATARAAKKARTS